MAFLRARWLRGLAATWATKNPVVNLSEPVHEQDTGKWKLGNGTSSYNDLPYQPDPATVASKMNSSARGAANGVAPLDGDSRVPNENLPTRLGSTELSAAIAGAQGAPERVLVKHRLAGGNEPGTFVAWTADDGYASFADYFSLLDAKNIKGTLFLTTNWVNRAGTDPNWSDTYITQGQVQAIADAGHEIGTHGKAHEGYSNYRDSNGDAALHALMQECVATIESTFGVEVKTGAYPAGQSDRRVREIVGRTHEFYRGTKGLVAHRGQNPFDVTAIDIQSMTEAAIKTLVDEAHAQGSLLVFLIHGLSAAEKAAALTKFGNVMDYIASLGIRQGTFYQGMMERTALRGSSGFSVDASGNTYARSLRATRVEVLRDDSQGDRAWFDLDETTNIPFFDASGGQTWEFRRPIRAASELWVGWRRKFSDISTTSGSAVISSATAGWQMDDIGRTVTGPGIPAGATIVSVASTNATLSAAATATASNVAVTIGRPTGQTAQFGNSVDFWSNLNLHNTGGVLFKSEDGDTEFGSITPTLWRRSGAGGPMTIDTGTGGSNFDLKAFRFRVIDQTGARRIALATAQPSDNSLANGEVGLYWDGATGELKFRGKDNSGNVIQRTVTAA